MRNSRGNFTSRFSLVVTHVQAVASDTQRHNLSALIISTKLPLAITAICKSRNLINNF